MKITESTLVFDSSREFKEESLQKTNLETWIDPVTVSISRSASQGSTQAAELFQNPVSINPISMDETDLEELTLDDPELAAMRRILEALTGRKIRLTDISRYRHHPEADMPKEAPSQEEPARIRQGWGVRLTQFRSLYEYEKTRVDAGGNVTTADGRTIDFSIHLEMEREFYSEEQTQLLAGDALTDPLVINFNGNAAELGDVKFKFDLNSDGTTEEISWLKPGSGFLVLDKNRDGIVNDGRELFGPGTGNGFRELADLDSDQNGWIDENDPGFELLSVWRGDSPDHAVLTGLAAAGVGALSLVNVESQFSLKDSTNSTLGMIRQTGVYINEDGSVGTLQQVDLAL